MISMAGGLVRGRAWVGVLFRGRERNGFCRWSGRRAGRRGSGGGRCAGVAAERGIRFAHELVGVVGRVAGLMGALMVDEEEPLPASLIGSDVLFLAAAIGARNTSMTAKRVRLDEPRRRPWAVTGSGMGVLAT